MDDVGGRFLGASPTQHSGSGPLLTLNLGVVVQPYRSFDLVPGEKRRKKGATIPVTTADVAKYLEDEYGVMQVFARVHWDDITKALAGSVEGALEALLMGQRVDPFGRGLQSIQTRFRRFISSYEAERVGIPGTPTKAALRGVNHRLKHPFAQGNPRRPSFRDTGTYQTSFRAWVT